MLAIRAPRRIGGFAFAIGHSLYVGPIGVHAVDLLRTWPTHKQHHVLVLRIDLRFHHDCVVPVSHAAEALTIQVRGSRVQTSVDGQSLFDVEDAQRPLDGGGIALICDEGRVGCDYVRAQPAAQR